MADHWQQRWTACHRILAEGITPIGARVRDLRLGPDGLVYLLTDELAGRLLRLVPASPRSGKAVPR